MPNAYYNHGSVPATGSTGSSASMRAEFDAITSGFALLPTLSGFANKAIVVNAGGTALTTTAGSLSLAGNLTLAGAFTTSGAYDLTATLTAATNVTFPTTGTLATLAGSETLSNKTIASPVLSGSVTGTYTLAGTLTITAPTISSPVLSGSVTGTYTLAGTLTITAPAISSPVLSGSVTGTYTLAGTPTITSPTLAGTPIFPDNVFTIGGSADATKKLAFEVDGFTTGTTRIMTPPNQDLVMATIWTGANDFRLSLTSAVPVTVADVVGAGVLYAVPYVGSRIALYNGTAWVLRTSAQFSLALVLTSGKPYDIFCYDNAGTPALEVLVWTNDTTRATALAYQDGVMVKSGDATRRYLGTLYASGANITEDSFAKRYLWNYYHRKTLPMRVQDTTNSWTYTTAVYRQANGAAGNQLDFVLGTVEDAVEAEVVAHVTGTTNAVKSVGVGLDSTTSNSATVHGGVLPEATSNQYLQVRARYVGYPGEGRHTLVWLEHATASGTATWYGDDGGSRLQSGITGVIIG